MDFGLFIGTSQSHYDDFYMINKINGKYSSINRFQRIAK